MLISSLPDTDGSRCTLTYDESNGWLRATWRGFVDMSEAMRGADNYLHQLHSFRCAYLLNDNAAMHGPWFDSIQWLEHVWVPQAVGMGLRYIAHVVQADALSDIVTVNFSSPHVGKLELQIFQDVPEAEAWLRSCQQHAALV